MTFCPTCGLDPCGNPQFCALCRDADGRKARGEQPRFSAPDRPIDWNVSPHLAFLRRIMEPNISIERAWDEINRAACERYNEAPEATYKAVVYELRTYGLPQLGKPNCQRRLAELSTAQFKSLMASLQEKRRQYPNISDELLAALGKIYAARDDVDGR